MPQTRDWPSTSETLVGLLRDNPRGDAWQVFVKIYGPLIYRFSRRRGLQDADADDTTQRVFLAVGRGIRRFAYDRSRGTFRAWLGTITAREVLQHLRSARREGQMSRSDMDAAVNDATWIAEFNSHIYQTALERIRPEFDSSTWDAFELLWTDRLKPAEVASQFGKTVNAIYQLKFRVLQRLEREVKFLTADIPSFSKE